MDLQRNDLKFCECCDRHLQVGCWEEHMNSKKHKMNWGRYNHEVRSAEKSVCVYNLKKGTTDYSVGRYFSQFGDVKGVFIDTNGIRGIVDFYSKLGAANALRQERHFLNSQPLTLKKRIPKFASRYKVADDDPPKVNSVVDGLLPGLHDAENVEDQLRILSSRVLIGPKDIKDRTVLCKMIEDGLQTFFPKCKVVPFGSSVNGIGIIGCDLDLYLDLDPCRNDEETEFVPGNVPFHVIRSNLQYVYDSGDLQFLKSLQLLDDKEIVVIISIVLQRFIAGCKRVFSIPQARCPVVSFSVPKFGIDCDMQTRNRLGVHNSVLLRVLQQIDSRVHQLLVAVRLWAKQHYLIDSKVGRFSSYAMAMITIFYLQNCQPPVLPSVDLIQELAEKPIMFGKWKISLCMDPARLPKSENTSDFESLFRGFFNFFAKLNHSFNVFSLQTGKCIPTSDFTAMKKTNQAILPFKLNRMNVQDPFELDRNIVGGVLEAGTSMWFESLDAACALMDSDRFADRSRQLWGLQALLTNELSLDERLTRVRSLKRSEPIAQPPPGGSLKTDTNSAVRVDFDSLRDLQVRKIHLGACAEDLATVREVVRGVFEIGLKFSCSSLAKPSGVAVVENDVTDSPANVRKTKRSKMEQKSAMTSHDQTSRKYVKLNDGSSSPSPTTAKPETDLSQTTSAAARNDSEAKTADKSEVDSPPSQEVNNVEPEVDSRGESSENCGEHMVLEGCSRIYKMRKAARSKIPLKDALAANKILTVEARISDIILADPLVGNDDSHFRFVAGVFPATSAPLVEETAFELHLWNLIPSMKEFDNNFQQFLSSYLPKILRQVIQERKLASNQ